MQRTAFATFSCRKLRPPKGRLGSKEGGGAFMPSLWDRRQQEARAEVKRLVAAGGAEPTEKMEQQKFRKTPAVKRTMSQGKLKTQAAGSRPSGHPKLLAWVDEV